MYGIICIMLEPLGCRIPLCVYVCTEYLDVNASPPLAGCSCCKIIFGGFQWFDVTPYRVNLKNNIPLPACSISRHGSRVTFREGEALPATPGGALHCCHDFVVPQERPPSRWPGVRQEGQCYKRQHNMRSCVIHVGRPNGKNEQYRS